MSWDISLTKDGHTIEVDTPHNNTGGTYVLGGTKELWLNVTYNYHKLFDFDKLAGLTGGESLELLLPAYEKFKYGIEDDDYWKPTEGNVARAMRPLIKWAREYPDGVWVIT